MKETVDALNIIRKKMQQVTKKIKDRSFSEWMTLINKIKSEPLRKKIIYTVSWDYLFNAVKSEEDKKKLKELVKDGVDCDRVSQKSIEKTLLKLGYNEKSAKRRSTYPTTSTPNSKRRSVYNIKRKTAAWH